MRVIYILLFSLISFSAMAGNVCTFVEGVSADGKNKHWNEKKEKVNTALTQCENLIKSRAVKKTDTVMATDGELLPIACVSSMGQVPLTYEQLLKNLKSAREKCQQAKTPATDNYARNAKGECNDVYKVLAVRAYKSQRMYSTAPTDPNAIIYSNSDSLSFLGYCKSHR